MTKLEKRREIVFLYSARDNNPNGDPDDENRPRTDDDNHVLVSDVRLKRTIRDYFLSKDGGSVLIRREMNSNDEIENIEGLIKMALGEKLTRDLIKEKLPELFLDVRLFGVTAAVKDAQTSLTGPVQFTIGHSLNIPRIYTHTITSTISAASGAGGAMGNYHVLDYAMIAFEGVICPYLAEKTGMSEEDLKKLFTGLWNGTTILQSRSKVGHVPKLLVSIVSKNADFLIGGLAYLLSMDDDSKNDVVVFDKFIDKITQYKENIEKIEYAADSELRCVYNGEEFDFPTLLKDKLSEISAEIISFED
ncbi:MAG: type I-B CRISPR-associated protein Cas7/Csh2 [Promethearchaeota archaeon]